MCTKANIVVTRHTCGKLNRSARLECRPSDTQQTLGLQRCTAACKGSRLPESVQQYQVLHVSQQAPNARQQRSVRLICIVYRPPRVWLLRQTIWQSCQRWDGRRCAAHRLPPLFWQPVWPRRRCRAVSRCSRSGGHFILLKRLPFGRCHLPLASMDAARQSRLGVADSCQETASELQRGGIRLPVAEPASAAVLPTV